MYVRFLKRMYERLNATWRREMRKHQKPCAMCADPNSEIMAEGIWLCREHKATWKNMLPYKSYAQRLMDMKVDFPTEEEWKSGIIKEKKKKLAKPKHQMEVIVVPDRPTVKRRSTKKK